MVRPKVFVSFSFLLFLNSQNIFCTNGSGLPHYLDEFRNTENGHLSAANPVSPISPNRKKKTEKMDRDVDDSSLLSEQAVSSEYSTSSGTDFSQELQPGVPGITQEDNNRLASAGTVLGFCERQSSRAQKQSSHPLGGRQSSCCSLDGESVDSEVCDDVFYGDDDFNASPLKKSATKKLGRFRKKGQKFGFKEEIEDLLPLVGRNGFESPVVTEEVLMKFTAKERFGSQKKSIVNEELFCIFVHFLIEANPEKPICFQFSKSIDASLIKYLLGLLNERRTPLAPWIVNTTLEVNGEIYLDHPAVMPVNPPRASPEAVMIVPYVVYPRSDTDPVILFVEKIQQKGMLCFPGGYIDKKENVFAAVKTEIQEELSGEIAQLLQNVCSNPDVYYFEEGSVKDVSKKRLMPEWKLILKRAGSFSNEMVMENVCSFQNETNNKKAVVTHVFYLFINGNQLNIENPDFFNPTDLKEVAPKPVKFPAHKVYRYHPGAFLYSNTKRWAEGVINEWRVIEDFWQTFFSAV